MIDGLSELFANIDTISKELLERRRKAFTRIGFKVKAKAVKNAPIITGNLRGSAFTDVKDDGVKVGFTAVYAANVHENMEGQNPKFLERAISEELEFIKAELVEATRV